MGSWEGKGVWSGKREVTSPAGMHGTVGDLRGSSLPPPLLALSRRSFPKMPVPFINKLNTHGPGVRLKEHTGAVEPVNRHTTWETEVPARGC